MRRRPMEIWWIAGFSLLKAIAAFNLAATSGTFEQNILYGYAAAFVISAGLLISFKEAGRWSSVVMLGLAALDHMVHAWPRINTWNVKLTHLVVLGFCAWMIFYLQSPSTRRLFTRMTSTKKQSGGIGLTVLDLLESVVGIAATSIALLFKMDMLVAGGIGLVSYIAYGAFFEKWVRRVWISYFPRGDAGLPEADRVHWRKACAAFSRNDLKAAREAIHAASHEARWQPGVQFFLQVIDWHELTAASPETGEGALRRSAYDHDWKPSDFDHKRMLDFIEFTDDETLRRLVDERAALIEGLVKAGLDQSSLFYSQSDDLLSKITGETFAFNTHENWTAWWDGARNDWTGDAGLVALTARLLRVSPQSASALAKKIAGRAEEPMLRELTSQVIFLNAMQKAIREHGGVEPFIRQPQRMLLVPELTDAVGLLHCDSQLLENLGMTLQSVARRLQVRVQLVDYIAELWRRYPDELGNDMPWLLKTLTGKNLGVLRAHAKFESWWPAVRESYIRHDRAVAAGLNAHAAGDEAGEEKAFRDALIEQPRELSSRYNLALCVKRKDHGQATHLLQELTELEPKEPYWWIVLGAMHRSVNKSADAHAAFRRALELGAAAPRVALHVGLTFARDRRDAEAIKQLDRALGTNPSASKIEALVSHLENEGLWKLAGHYRDEAFRRSLSQPNGSGDDDGGDPDEDVAA